YFGGFNMFLPILSTIALILILGNISFPGTVSFIGEFLITFSLNYQNFYITLISLIGIILSGIYSLWLYNRIFFGQLIRFKLKYNFYTNFLYKKLYFSRLWTNYFIDLNKREILVFFPLLTYTLILGLNPFFIIHTYLLNIIITFKHNYIFL